MHKFLETCHVGSDSTSSHSGASNDVGWDNHAIDDVWTTSNGAVESRIHDGDETLSSSKQSLTSGAAATSGVKSTPVISVNLDEIDLTRVDDPYKLLPPIDASVLIDWSNDDVVESVGSSVRAEEVSIAEPFKSSPEVDANAALPDLSKPEVDVPEPEVDVPETPVDGVSSKEAPTKEAPTKEADVAEETLDKMVKEKWSGVNGCYDDAGDWRDWTQIIALSSYGGDDINILPYVDIDG